jgi:cytochrome c
VLTHKQTLHIFCWQEQQTYKMKPFFAFLLFSFIVSCNTQTKENSGESTATDSLVNSPGAVSASSYQQGARLVAENDCLTCHRLEEKSVGPSFYEISKKYPFDTGVVSNLAHSIIHGSKGLYGPQAMTPHPNVPYYEAKEMAAYILSVRDSSVTRVK